jgi:hypothetical protein
MPAKVLTYHIGWSLEVRQRLTVVDFAVATSAYSQEACTNASWTSPDRASAWTPLTVKPPARTGSSTCDSASRTVAKRFSTPLLCLKPEQSRVDVSIPVRRCSLEISANQEASRDQALRYVLPTRRASSKVECRLSTSSSIV